MTENGVTIREVRTDDVPAVIELISEVLAEHGMAFGVGSGSDAQLRELPGSYTAEGGAFWVAVREDTGALLGTAGIAPVGGGDWELRKMYLRPASRGLGLGARLLDAAVAHARASGARRVVLDTAETMQRAIAFYEAHGFVRDDAQIRGARCSRGYARVLG